MRWLFKDFRYKLLAAAIAAFLWAVAHGSASVDRGFDVPVVFQNIPEHLVLTERSSDAINMRVAGRRSVLRNLSEEDFEYAIDVTDVKPGEAGFEVDIEGAVDLPRGLRVQSRSPSHVTVKFERKGRKTVRVRADLEGEPPVGYELAGVELSPTSVRVAGARSEVRRLNEVMTEPIDLSEAVAPIEREVRVLLGARNVWVEGEDPVLLKLIIQPTLEPEEPAAGDDPA